MPKSTDGLVQADAHGIYIVRDKILVFRPAPTDQALTGSAVQHYIHMADRGINHTGGVFSPRDASESLIEVGTQPKTLIRRNFGQLFVTRPNEKIDELWWVHGVVSEPLPFDPFDRERIRAAGWNIYWPEEKGE